LAKQNLKVKRSIGGRTLYSRVAQTAMSPRTLSLKNLVPVVVTATGVHNIDRWKQVLLGKVAGMQLNWGYFSLGSLHKSTKQSFA